MNPATVLDFVTLFFAGILAGIEIVIHYGLRAPAEVLGEPSQIQLRQALILRLRVLVPAFFVPTTVSGIAVTVLDGAAPGFGFRCAALFAMLIWILIRVIGTVRSTVPRSPGSPVHLQRIGGHSSTSQSGSILLVPGRRSRRSRSS